MNTPLPSFAVVLKTYAWDDFVLRQAERCASATGRGDFFISVDETNGSVGPIPFPRVIRTNCSEMVELGLANRFEHGSLLWWNADYAHYQFFRLYPGYDFFVFVEYDALVHLQIEELINQLAARSVDCLSLPIVDNIEDWCWTIPHQPLYSTTDIQGALICFTAFSKRALQLLFARRLEMAQTEAVSYWPSAEAFIPSETRRLDLASASLKDFADVAYFSSSHPLLERFAIQATPPALLHPVLNSERFLRRVRSGAPDVWLLLDRGNITSRNLLRYHPFDFALLFLTAVALGSRRTVQRWFGSALPHSG